MRIEDILVPVDFSPNSLRAVDFAKSLIAADGEIYLLHVIDSDFVARLSDEGFSDPETAIDTMRRKAESALKEVIDANEAPGPMIDSMVVIGKPFAEILRVAIDLDFQMIVLGTHGKREGIEELLFGSTAEKVLRGARIPVVCVPGVPLKG